MHKRFIIRVIGSVQHVAYREFVHLVANRLGVTGYAENLSDGAVSIIGEGEEEVLRQFIKELWAKEEPLIHVQSIDISETDTNKEFSHFEPYFGDFQKEIFHKSELVLEYMKEIIRLQKLNFKMQEEYINAIKDLKKESKKSREVLERVIEAIHTQGVG